AVHANPSVPLHLHQRRYAAATRPNRRRTRRKPTGAGRIRERLPATPVRASMTRKEADMSFTRRAFVKVAGIGGASLLAARRDAWAGLFQAPGSGRPPRPLLLHNNENPLGPGEAVLDA